MAMGMKAQREVKSAIANCRPFENSTGSMRGTKGATRELGWLRAHRNKDQIKELLSRAIYVVWSYDTPIGCVSEDEDGNVTKVYFDESHTTTTSHHQTLCRVGFSDFETVGEGPWSRGQSRARMQYRTVRNEVISEDALAARSRSVRTEDIPENARAGFTVQARRLDPVTRIDGSRMDFAGQDELISEVRGYRAPHHP